MTKKEKDKILDQVQFYIDNCDKAAQDPSAHSVYGVQGLAMLGASKTAFGQLKKFIEEMK